MPNVVALFETWDFHSRFYLEFVRLFIEKTKSPASQAGLKRCQLVRYPSSNSIIANQCESRSRAEDDGLEP